MEFKDFLEMSSLRDLLGNVPQHPKHHPEGNVFQHSRMVRNSLDKALETLVIAQTEPNSPLKNVDFRLSDEEIAILKVAAWMHDIGKPTATAITPGKGYQALRHDAPEHYIPNMRKLKGSAWEKIWNAASTLAKKDLFFIIQQHMGLRSQGGKIGFGKQRGNRLVDEKGFFKNTRKVKLLLILVLMDRLGRDVPGAEQDAWDAVDAYSATAKERFRRAQPGFGGGTAAPDSPDAFLRQLAGKPEDVVRRAFQGKFGRPPTPEEL